MALTDKVKGEDKKENDAYYKEVEKKMSDYEKASTSSSPDAIEEPKFNYDYEDEVEYHEDMEIRNGMEMLNYERKPSEKFSQRAKEAIEGSSNMGNNPEWANVYPEQQGFTGPEFGKKLVKTIERSKAKRDAATPTLDQFGDDIEEKNVGVNKTKSAYKPKAMKKPVAIQESKKIKINEALTEKGLESVSKWIDENGSRGAGIKLIDAILRKKIGLSSSDLADSSTFMNGLDAVEEALDEKDLQGAYNIAKETAMEMIDEEGESYGFMGEGSGDNINPKYTHFAIDKSTGEVVNGWEYEPEEDRESIKYYCKMDLEDMFPDRKPSEFKVLTAKALTKQGIDPFNSDNWQKMGINEDTNTNLELKNVAKQIFGILKKYQLKPSYEVDGKEFNSKEPQQGYGARIVIDNNGMLTVAVYDRGIWQTLGRIDELDMGPQSYPNERERKAINDIASKIYKDIVATLGNDKFEFRSNKEPDRYGNYIIQIRKKSTENNNKSEIKESTKMKRLKFKKPFNGIETALRVIPESYRVDNKVFEMTDGNENYKIRWEGSLTEGKAVVLTAYDKTLVKEDMDKIKHLMGFKSQDTLGNLKGKQRIEENNVFADMLKKTRTLMTEGEDVEKTGKYDDGDGEKERCDYVPCDEETVSGGGDAEHLQELSPETYDKVRAAGLERGDSKGEELAKKANELKYRDVIGKAVKYLPTDGLGRKGNVDKIYKSDKYVDIHIWDGDKMDLIRIYKDSNDVKVQGLKTEVDRPTANVLAKVKKLAFGVESKANDFKQLAETDKPDF